MKVVYSVATRFGGSGIGTTAYNAAFGIYKAGILERVSCSSKVARSIPLNLIHSTGVSFFENIPLLPSSFQWLFKDVAHDFLTSRLIDSMSLGAHDILHVWNGHGLYCLKVAKRKGLRSVVERASSHPLTFERIMNEEYRSRGLKFSQMLSFNRRRLLEEFNQTDFITVPSEFAYKSMLENGIKEERLVKIPFGTDVGRFRPAVSSPHSVFNVLFAGQVGLRKGVLYLLEAWQKLKLKDARLTIVGQIDAEMENLLVSYGTDPTIKFLGYSDLLPLYQSSDVFVFPSLEEGSALVNYEALSCGLPVITTFESGSLVTDGQEGFIVRCRDSDDIAEKLSYLYQNPSVRLEMGERARSQAQQYSWERYGQSLVGFYENIS